MTAMLVPTTCRSGLLGLLIACNSASCAVHRQQVNLCARCRGLMSACLSNAASVFSVESYSMVITHTLIDHIARPSFARTLTYRRYSSVVVA